MGSGVGIEHQLVGVEAMTGIGLVGPMNPQTVHRSGRDIRYVAVPETVGIFRKCQPLELALPVSVEETHFNPARVRGEDREVGPLAIPGCTLRLVTPFFDAAGVYCRHDMRSLEDRRSNVRSPATVPTTRGLASSVAACYTTVVRTLDAPLRAPSQTSFAGRKTAPTEIMKVPKGLQPLIDDGVIDEVIRSLKSGKEATVYVVRSGAQLRCAKVYRDMAPAQFPEARSIPGGA